MPGIRKRMALFLILFIFFILSCRETSKESAADLLVKKQKRDLQDEKAALKDNLRKLEIKTNAFDQDKKTDELNRLAQVKTELGKQLAEADQACSNIKLTLHAIENEAKKLENQLIYANESRQKAAQNIRTGVIGADSTITRLENENQIEQKKIPILKKKISISSTKIQAYQEEKSLHEELKTNKIRENAPKHEVDVVSRKIAEVSVAIDLEYAQLAASQLQITTSENRIKEIESHLRDLTQLVRDNYDKKEVLTDFIDEEAIKLKMELEKSQATIQHLNKMKNIYEHERAGISSRIAGLNRKLGLQTSTDLPAPGIREDEINKDSLIDPEKMHLAEDGQVADSDSNLQRFTYIPDGSAGIDSAFRANQSPAANKSYLDLKEAAAISKKRVQKYEIWGYTTMILLLSGLVVLISFYIIGRSVAHKKEHLG